MEFKVLSRTINLLLLILDLHIGQFFMKQEVVFTTLPLCVLSWVLKQILQNLCRHFLTTIGSFIKSVQI
jgi:hypothetical protein